MATVDTYSVNSTDTAFDRNDSGSPVRHLIITVHGIRTFGRWQERLESILKAKAGQTRQLTVNAYKYGYFSVFAFLVPFLRWLVTLRFRRTLLRVAQDGTWDRIDLVGHSFGTHIIAWGLHGIKQELRPNVHTIILSGSVLKSNFPWDDLIGKTVVRVVNECGTRDKILLLSQFFILFTGMAGRIGFTGMTNNLLRNRFFAIGHSGYFLQNGRPDDLFMKKYWLPVITSDEEVPLVDERQENIFSGPLTFLANNAEPIKLTIYILPLLIGLWAVYGLYVEAEQQRQVSMSRVLAFESNEAKDIELRLRLSLEALRVSDTLEARKSLIHNVSSILGLESFSYLCCADDAISTLAFSENDNSVFSGDIRGNIVQWDLATEGSHSLGKPLEGKVLHIGTIDDGKNLVALATKQAFVIDLDTSSLNRDPIDLPFQEISSAVLSGKGNRLAVGAPDGKIAVLDLRKGKWSKLMVDTKLQIEVISLSFHPNEVLLAASYNVPPVQGFEQPIVMWNVLTGERVNPSFVGHRFEVTSLDFSSDTMQLASGSWDQDVRLWDIATGRTIPPVLVKAAQESGSVQWGSGPTQVAISPDGEILASLMKDSVSLWDIATHKSFAQFWSNQGMALTFSPQGKLIAVGGEARNVVLIPTDFEYWLKTACAKALRPLTSEEKRYYMGETRDRGAFANLLWDMYWSIQSLFGETRHQRGMTGDPCIDIKR